MKDYKTIYFDNYDAEELFSREDFECLLQDRFSDEEIEEMTESEKDSLYWDDYYEYESDEFEITYNALLEYFGNKTLLAKGSCGRWNGTRSGIAIINCGELGDYEDLKSFLYSFTKDCEYYQVGITKDNKIFIKATHHDGTNYTELKEVSEKGEDLYDGYYHAGRLSNYSVMELLNKLWNSKVYSSKLEKDFNLYDYS